MKTMKIFALALAAGLAAACGSGPKNMAEPYHISLDPGTIDRAAPFPVLSDFVESIEYIPLEYAPDMPVGRIFGRPAITDDYSFFFDNAQGVLQYSRTGQFIRRVGHIGRGPGEYQNVGGVWVDQKRGTVHTIPMWGDNTIHIYDIETGRSIEDAAITDPEGNPVRMESAALERLSDDRVVITRGRTQSYHYNEMSVPVAAYMTVDVATWRVTRLEMSTLYPPVSAPGSTIAIFPTPIWLDDGGRVNLFENMADTMYVVRPDGELTPRIVADFGGAKIESNIGPQKGAMILGAQEGARHIVFETGYRDERVYIAFDKTTGVSAISDARPVNDIDGGLSSLSPAGEGLWWGSFDAFEMIETLTDEHFAGVRASVKDPAALDRLQALVAGLTEDDNPVIAIAHIKK